MKIAIGNDHRGYDLKNFIIKNMPEINWVNVGSDSFERTDYPIYVKKVCDLLLSKEVEFGVLVCASGAGMSIAANRFKGIYAALVWNIETAMLSKQDDNANVLIFPADFVNKNDIIEMINVWLKSQFKQGRYLERIKMIDKF